MTRYYGKYRGSVVNNVDPNQMGRLQVSCPQVLGESVLSWAMPCAPVAGRGVGFFAVPPIGANVWLEFEGGDADHPIWVGGFWGLGEAPALPALPTTAIWKTQGATLKFDDLPGAGGITLELMPPVAPIPMTLKFSAAGIELTHGAAKIVLSPADVDINNGAFKVI